MKKISPFVLSLIVACSAQKCADCFLGGPRQPCFSNGTCDADDLVCVDIAPRGGFDSVLEGETSGDWARCAPTRDVRLNGIKLIQIVPCPPDGGNKK